MSDLSWLDTLRNRFSLVGVFHDDLYGLIRESIVRGRVGFPALIFDASNGLGFTVSEGFFYSLDQDWDEPEKFNEVCFFLGEMETSSLPVEDYLNLMRVAAETYSEYFQNEREGVLRSAERLERRYARFLR